MPRNKTAHLRTGRGTVYNDPVFGVAPRRSTPGKRAATRADSRDLAARLVRRLATEVTKEGSSYLKDRKYESEARQAAKIDQRIVDKAARVALVKARIAKAGEANPGGSTRA